VPDYRWRDLLLVPNLLSGARVPLALAFPLAAASPAHSLGVLGAAGVTDMLDGWTARKLGQASPLGAVIDGVADKLFAASVLGSLLAARVLSPATALLLATRELLELPLAVRVLTTPKARVVEHGRSANTLGKLATALEFAAIVAVVARAKHAKVLVAATALCGAAAAGSYWVRELRAIRDGSRARRALAVSRRVPALATPAPEVPPPPSRGQLPPIPVPPSRRAA